MQPLILRIASVLCLVTAFAHTDAEAQLYLQFEIQPKNSIEDYIQAQSAISVALDTADPEGEYSYAWNDSGTVTVIREIASLADVDTWMQTWSSMCAKTEHQAKCAALQSRQAELDSRVFRLRPDLSSLPENPRVPADKVGYNRVYLFDVEPDRVSEFTDAIRGISAITQKVDARARAVVVEQLLGESAPRFAIVVPAIDEADSVASDTAIAEAGGSERQALIAKAIAATRNWELRGSRPYTP